MWIEMWQSIHKLNSQILRDRHKLSYIAITLTDDLDPVKIDWVLRYSRAMIHEIAEYFDEKDNHKTKIELIDILFFLIGVMQLVGFSSKEFEDYMNQIKSKIRDYVDYYPEDLLFTAIAVENEIAWKHWKTYTVGLGPMFYINLKKFINEWWRHVELKGMTKDVILKGFQDKLEVNHKRQKQQNRYTKKIPGDDKHVRTN